MTTLDKAFRKFDKGACEAAKDDDMKRIWNNKTTA